MSQIKAVIYDVDGTMVDSEPLHVEAWDKALRQHGHEILDLSEDFQATMAGKKSIVIAEGMVKELHLSISAQEFLNLKAKLFLELVRTDLKSMPGAVESVYRIAGDGYELAIGTSLDRNYIDLVLTKLGLTDSFRVIVTGDQIKNGKPHPETYLSVAQQLGRQPSECIVLEDAKSGIQSAKAARMLCIAIENPNALPQDTAEAEAVVQSLNEVTKELVSSLVN